MDDEFTSDSQQAFRHLFLYLSHKFSSSDSLSLHSVLIAIIYPKYIKAIHLNGGGLKKQSFLDPVPKKRKVNATITSVIKCYR